MFKDRWSKYSSNESYRDELIQYISNRIGKPPVPYKSSGLLAQDPQFVFRGDPSFRYHDVLGYKNYTVPTSASILCLGNSHVHDTTHPIDTNWTWLLQSQTEKSVYNGSIGGSSIIQALLSLEELLYLQPNFVILSLYTGTHFYNSVSTIDQIFHAQNVLESKYVNFYEPFRHFYVDHWRTMPAEKLAWWRRVNTMELVNNDMQQAFIKKYVENGKESAIKANIIPEDLLQFNNFCLLADTPLSLHLPARTILQDPYYKPVAQTIEVITTCLDIFYKISTKYNFSPILLLLPTKEFVLHQALKFNRDLIVFDEEQLEEHARIEMNSINFVHDICRMHGIYFIDPTLELARHCKKESAYRIQGLNGHPNDAGKAIIARKVAQYIKEL